RECHRWGAVAHAGVVATTLETERLILRDWREEDREPFAALNADPRVMEHYPAPLTRPRATPSSTDPGPRSPNTTGDSGPSSGGPTEGSSARPASGRSRGMPRSRRRSRSV